MIDIYIQQIGTGKMSLENVPSLWRKKVAEKLKENQVEVNYKVDDNGRD